MNADAQRSIPNRELLRLHVEAVWGVIVPELIDGDLELSPRQSERAKEPGPLWEMYSARFADGGSGRLWRADVSPGERAELKRLTERALDHPEELIPGVRREVVLRQSAEPHISLADAERVARILGPDDAALASAFYADDPDYLLAPERAPVVAVVVDGRALSVAHSSRRTENACELGVDTKPEARRAGYALAVTILWARAVRSEGLIPFYSAFAENSASLALAHAAGYRELARSAYIRR